MTIELVIFGSVLLGIGAGLLLERFRGRIDAAPAGNMLQLGAPGQRGLAFSGAPGKSDGVAQLRLVSDARFSAKRLMSDNEAQVLAALETIIADMGQDWRVMAQVELREIIASNDAAAISAIADQRIDMVIMGGDRTPIAAIECQPLGQIRDGDAVRDAVRREALRRAGVAYFEVRASDPPGVLRGDIASLVGMQAARVAGPAAVAAEVQARPRKPRGKPASEVNP